MLETFDLDGEFAAAFPRAEIPAPIIPTVAGSDGGTISGLTAGAAGQETGSGAGAAGGPAVGHYVDLAAFLADGMPEPPAPTLLRRTDGVGIFYRGHANVLYGDPGCGKTLIVQAGLAECAVKGWRCAFIDIDHNGKVAVCTRLGDIGMPLEVLTDPDRFRLYEPQDKTEVLAVIEEIKAWIATGLEDCEDCHAMVGIDSIGELLPMFGASSNDADDYSTVNRAVMVALTDVGATVVAVDHMAKGFDSRAFGATGTGAKKRAVDGTMIKVTLHETFVPKVGGSAALTVSKDRNGGLLRYCPQETEPSAGLFVLKPNGVGGLDYAIHPSHKTKEEATQDKKSADVWADVATLGQLDPEPASKRDVMARMAWGSKRAAEALKVWREAKDAKATEVAAALERDAAYMAGKAEELPASTGEVGDPGGAEGGDDGHGEL